MDGRRLSTWRFTNYAELILCAIASTVYCWDLTINGWGNPYYAAAAQAGAEDWGALFFGAADAGNGLTVDKPPLHLWIIAATIKLFGLNSFSVLVPQALMGIATVILVQRTVLYWSGRREAFLAGLFVVLTPVTSMIFRFNNPDALLLFLWALAVHLSVRAVARNQIKYLYIAATVLGLAFLCKQFQSWIIVPAIGVAFLAFGFGSIKARLIQLMTAAALMLLPPALWIAAVELTPAVQRPWVGGTAGNSFLELTFGYNGFGRLTGQTDLGAVNPKDFSGLVGNDASLVRLLTINYAPEVAWMLPAAFIGGAMMAVKLFRKRHCPTQTFASGLLVVWFITAFAVLSFMTGDIHPYYASMLAVPLSFLAAHAFDVFWGRRNNVRYQQGAALVALFCAVLTTGILTWFQDWNSWAALLVKVMALAASLLLVLPLALKGPRLVITAFLLAGLSILMTPTMFILESITTPQQGSFPISGPVPSTESWHKRDADQLLLGEKEKYALARGEPVVADIAAAIEQVPESTRWAAATTGSQNAALYQLATGRAVMSIGGFSTGDVYPAIRDFKQSVAQGEISFYIHQPGVLEWANSSSNTRAIVSWIEQTFEYEVMNGVRVYKLVDFPQ